MTHFLGTHHNRLDAKGRVSVPAPFRAALRAQAGGEGAEFCQMILRPSHTHACIEGWPHATFSALANPLEQLDIFSQAHDDLAAALYTDAHPAEADREGRIVIPAELLAHAGITTQATFLGLGRTFQIWEPEAANRRRAEARERARAGGLTLAGSKP
jgi:MraZ protein